MLDLLNEIRYGQILVSLVSLGVLISVYLLFGRARVTKCEGSKYVAKVINEADPRLRMSATEMAEALRKGEFTSKQIVELYIEQIEKVNPHLNALVGFRFDDAREEARLADVRLDRARKNRGSGDDLPILLGVPCIIKEVFEFPGFPFTGGIIGRRDEVGVRTAPAVQRLQNSGAIILGCGNTSEGCMWSESNNNVHGRSKNPYDLSRTPGGSSGGNASIVAALGAPFAVTSDVGGSTRIPSLYNGLYGHKPSGGAIPNCRTVPVVRGEVERFCQLGPCVRSAKDLMPILELLAGPTEDHEIEDALDHEFEHHERQREYMKVFHWKSPLKVNVRKLRYYVVWDQPGAELGLISKRHKDMIRCQKKVVAEIESWTGEKVRPVQFTAFEKCFDIWAATLQKAQGDHTFLQVISEGKPKINAFLELLKWLLTCGRRSDHTLPALGLALAESIKDLTPRKNARMIELGNELQGLINDLLKGDGVLVFPALPNPAPTHGPLPNLLYFADFAACGIFNTLELPCTSCPVGLSRKESIPVGVQLVGAHGMDHNTIAVAMALEKANVTGWVPPLR